MRNGTPSLAHFLRADFETVRQLKPRGEWGRVEVSLKGHQMPKYNRNFDLTLSDIDMIEAALNVVKRDLSLGREGSRALLPELEDEDPLREIDDLLGRLHNQKIFYRPSNEPYVSG